ARLPAAPWRGATKSPSERAFWVSAERPGGLLVDAAAHDHVADTADIGGLAFHLAGFRILEHIVLPAVAALAGNFHALLDIALAVRIGGVDLVLADQGRVAAVRQHGSVHAIDEDVEVADDEFAVRIVDLAETGLASARLQHGGGLVHQGLRVVGGTAREGADGLLERGGGTVQQIRFGRDLLQAGAVFLSHHRDALDVVGNVGAGDALFADRVGDLVHHVHRLLRAMVDVVERGAGLLRQRHALLHLVYAGVHAFRCRLHIVLDGRDHAADLIGGARRAFRQFAHLVGDDGEAAALFAGARRLNGGVQREQIGLVGDVLDDLDNAADFLGAAAQFIDLLR